jgi:hypothetical protein
MTRFNETAALTTIAEDLRRSAAEKETNLRLELAKAQSATVRLEQERVNLYQQFEQLEKANFEIRVSKDQEAKALRNQLDQSERRVTEILASTSWYVTAPLRAAKRALVEFKLIGKLD